MTGKYIRLQVSDAEAPNGILKKWELFSGSKSALVGTPNTSITGGTEFTINYPDSTIFDKLVVSITDLSNQKIVMPFDLWVGTSETHLIEYAQNVRPSMIDGNGDGIFMLNTAGIFYAISPPPTATTKPIYTIEEQAVIDADKALVVGISDKLRAGQYITEEESIMFIVGVTVITTQIMGILQSGGGYDELLAAGISASNVYRILGTYNVTQETSRIKSEQAIITLVDDFDALKSFVTYLEDHNLPIPNFTNYLPAIRANEEAYNAIDSWYQQYIAVGG